MFKAASFALDYWLGVVASGATEISTFVGERIFPEEAEPGSAFPYLVFATKATRNNGRMGKNRSNREIIEREFRFVEKFGAGLGSWESLTTPADKLAELLNERPSPRLDGFVVSGSLYVREVRRIEPLGEERLFHLGGVVRFYIDRLPV